MKPTISERISAPTAHSPDHNPSNIIHSIVINIIIGVKSILISIIDMYVPYIEEILSKYYIYLIDWEII